MEEWRKISICPVYEVSNLGNVRNGETGRVFKEPKPCHEGYCRVTLKDGGKNVYATVHRLVATAFLERKDGQDEVHHKNGNKADNRVDNLEWVTKKEHAEKERDAL